MADSNSPPDEITEQAVELIKYMEGGKSGSEKSVSSIEL